MAESKLLAAVLIKSPIGAKPDAARTLQLLGLKRTNTAALLADNETYRSMLQIIKDYVAWGIIGLPLAARTLEKRTRVDQKRAKEVAEGIFGGKSLSALGVAGRIRLHPPTGGFKKAPKRPIGAGGETGYRGEKMEELLERMI